MFENFELMTQEELKPYYKSGYYKFRIELKGFYGWGKGYYSNATARDFEHELLPYVQLFAKKYVSDYSKTGYYESDSSGGCDTIRAKVESNPTYAYLHPMEFTGYGKKDFVDGLLGAIREGIEAIKKNCGYEAPYTVSEISTIPVPLIPDNAYRKILADKADRIVDELKRAKSSRKYANLSMDRFLSEAGFEFAEKANVTRAGDPTGISSDTLCVEAIEMIGITADKLGAFDAPEKKKQFRLERD
jgi:hypothetical protein